MKVNKYSPFAFTYFFVNSVGLPFGLLFTALLTPLFYLWITIKGKKQVILKFLFFSMPFILVHLIIGVQHFQYFKSLALFFSVYIFCYAFYTAITSIEDLEGIFSMILRLNFFLTIIALLFVFSSYRDLFWEQSHWSSSADAWPRLKMFTYEASYYSTLLVPIIGFYLLKIILKLEKNVMKTLLMTTLPLVLSLSLGVIASLVLSIACFFVIHSSKFLTSKRLLYSLTIITALSTLVFMALLIFYPDNPIFARAMNFIAGSDQSGRGRTSEAFQLAYQIANEKSIWWGVGPGQLKIIGDPIIREFYNYQADYGQVSIPNAFAETIALFGIVGAIIRVLVEVYLFFRTKVLNNYFQTLLFFHIFIYQFTGSFTTNIAEYVIWILAFTNVFPEFDKKTGSKKN